jgi:uncharacterized protein
VIDLTRAALRQLLRRLLHTRDTPERTAAAYALGVFWGYSPLLGLHTVLGVGSAFALRLNRVAAVLGVYSNLPWTMAPYYTLATVAGAALLGVPVPDGLIADIRLALNEFTARNVGRLLDTLAPLLWAFVVGSTLGAILASTVAYWLALSFIRARRRRQDLG